MTFRIVKITFRIEEPLSPFEAFKVLVFRHLLGQLLFTLKEG